MAKQYYDQKINKNTDWGGDSSTGGLQVKGNRVQEFIKDSLNDLDQKSSIAFGGFVIDVTISSGNVGSTYDEVVYDTENIIFLAKKVSGTKIRYYREFDNYALYNNGDVLNCYPYVGKVYVCGGNTYVWNGEALVSTSPIATEESVRAIVSGYEPTPENNND